MTVLAIAHGAGNSLAGLQAANALGVDVIECDVHRHRGNLEVRHLKTAGPLPLLWDRWELASASAPRLGLAELLEAGRNGSTFMLDLKGWRPALATAVATTLHELAPERPVLACGRRWRLVDELARLPYVRPVLSARTRGELALLRRRLASGSPTYGVSVHRSLLDRRVVAELSGGTEVVMTWPVVDLATLATVLDLGVTGVISHERDVLGEVLARRR